MVLNLSFVGMDTLKEKGDTAISKIEVLGTSKQMTFFDVLIGAIY